MSVPTWLAPVSCWPWVNLKVFSTVIKTLPRQHTGSNREQNEKKRDTVTVSEELVENPFAANQTLAERFPASQPGLDKEVFKAFRP